MIFAKSYNIKIIDSKGDLWLNISFISITFSFHLKNIKIKVDFTK